MGQDIDLINQDSLKEFYEKFSDTIQIFDPMDRIINYPPDIEENQAVKRDDFIQILQKL